MARIRSIKPEFWTSAQILECSTNARLMFIGLWNFCDDLGRHPLSTKQVKAEIFPADPFSESDILGMLKELSSNGLILIYSVESKEYLQVTGWKHQRIDKPQPHKYPGPFDDHSKNTPGVFPPDRIGEDKIRENISVDAGSTESELQSKKTARTTNSYTPEFEDFWRLYPKREGANPKFPASKKFLAVLKEGVDPGSIIEGASRLAAAVAEGKFSDARYIPQAVTWISQRRWQDDYGHMVSKHQGYSV